MEARKANKVYHIEKLQADEYAAAGYDIFDGKKLVKPAANKTVPYSEYMKVVEELESLKKAKAATSKAEAKTETEKAE